MEQRAELFYYTVFTPEGPVVKFFSDEQERNRFADQDALFNDEVYLKGNREGALTVVIDDYGIFSTDIDPTYDRREFKVKDDPSGCPSPCCDCSSPSCS